MCKTGYRSPATVAVTVNRIFAAIIFIGLFALNELQKYGIYLFVEGFYCFFYKI